MREDFTSVSDIDFLVEFLPNARVGYFEIVRMENELTDLVGRKADLRTPKELSPYFRQNVLNEAVVQYVKNWRLCKIAPYAYFDIDLDIVWDTATLNIPALAAALDSVLS